MTPRGKEFTERFEQAKALILSGTAIYVALSISFDDEDWTLAFAAINRLAEDIVNQK